MNHEMVAYVVVATKGRPKDVQVILGMLAGQTRVPAKIIFVGTCADDLGEIGQQKNTALVECIISPKTGATVQRNTGLERVLDVHGEDDNFIVIYFDDDFRPHNTWVENALERFSQFNTAALTGIVLADGIKTLGISEEDARKFLDGDLPQDVSHWTAKFPDQEVRSTYGCNMAFSGEVSRSLRFDEALPAYAWQEDRDYSRRASKFGQVWCSAACVGVHLGTKGGRVSGVRFGYSQIANPIYLRRKGTMSIIESAKLIARNMLANHAKMFFPEAWVDRIGRVRGNWIAIVDFFGGRLAPQRIDDL